MDGERRKRKKKIVRFRRKNSRVYKIGGFVLLVYLAVFTETQQLAAQGLNLFFFLPVIAVSVALHIKNRLIDVKTALVIGAAGAATSVLGWLLAQQLQGNWLRRCFAMFLIAIGLRDLFTAKEQ